MKMRSMVAGILLVLASAPAFALSVSEKVTPKWTKESGVTVQTEKREDGSIGFTVTRYLDTAPAYPADSEFTTIRSAHLEIRNSRDSLAQTRVEAEIKRNTAVYWFSLSPSCLPYSRFTLSERGDFKDIERQNLKPGGGRFYEFDLAEFAAPLLKPPLPAHP